VLSELLNCADDGPIEPEESEDRKLVMAFIDPHVHETTTQATWFDYLVAETPRLDETGVLAALVSVRLAVSDHEQTQMATLLRRTLASTDAFHLVAQGYVSILLAPVASVLDTRDRVEDIQSMLRNFGQYISMGYAIRRPDESLLDTCARADAQADRAAFRLERSQSSLILPK